jgi:hypothetical protein
VSLTTTEILVVDTIHVIKKTRVMAQTESDYLRRLRAIQDTYDPNGPYEKAKLQVEAQLTKQKERTTFNVCVNESEHIRKYVVERFIADGLQAELYDYVHTYYNGDDEHRSGVSVTIPRRGRT